MSKQILVIKWGWRNIICGFIMLKVKVMNMMICEYDDISLNMKIFILFTKN